MSKKERLGIRTDKDLKKRLKVLADNENRTLSNYIEHLLKKKVQEYEDKEAREAKAFIDSELSTSQKATSPSRKRDSA